MSVRPPRAEKRVQRHVVHGIVREDPYRWLRDDAWQKVMHDPSALRADIRAYLEAENAYTASVMAPIESLQRRLFEEMKGRIKENDASVPAPDGAWAYYYRYEVGAQHPVFCRRPTDARDENGEEVLYDADAAARGRAYFRVAGVAHSPDHDRIAYAYDDKGSEFFEVRFRDLVTGEGLPDALQRCSGVGVWANDGETLLYTVLDENHRPCKVMRHEIGTDPSEDALVYEDRDPGFFLGIGITENRAHIIIDSHDHTTSEVRILDAYRPDHVPRLVAARRRDVEYHVSQQGDRLVILTNDGGAEDFKIVTVEIDDPRPEKWVDLVPHRPGRLILSVMTFEHYIVRLEREGGLPRIVVRDDAGEEHAIAFDEEAYSLGLLPSYEYKTTKLRFTYSSLTTPEQTYEYDLATRQRVLLKEQEIPSGHDPTHYRSARIEATSHDGEKVPISILWHRDTPIDGSAPLLLYGYGAYGLSIPAAFETTRLSLVDRGFVWAVAHVRGGKEKGYAWYTQGKGSKKKNSFLDFIAAAEELCRRSFTRAGNITIRGGSAGGMLVGAVVNMRPDLFRAVVAEVPFVDVLDTMCDDTLPLTPPEWNEWGNPLESEEAYHYIASYSPYDNVTARPYPHILATAGLTDPRVTYWEPAKWIARLREMNTGDGLILLRTYMEAGHAGAAGRFEKLEEVALVHAFVLLAHGMADGEGSEPERA